MDAGSAISAWVLTSVHDKLIAMAAGPDMSVSAVVRQIVTLRLRGDSDAD